MREEEKKDGFENEIATGWGERKEGGETGAVPFPERMRREIFHSLLLDSPTVFSFLSPLSSRVTIIQRSITRFVEPEELYGRRRKGEGPIKFLGFLHSISWPQAPAAKARCCM